MVDGSLSCSAQSQQVGENLFGTGLRVDVWLALEYNRPWGARALPQSDLPDAVKNWLDAQTAALPNARLQFIKQQPTRESDRIAFFVARSTATDPALHRLDLESYEALLALDMAAILSGDVVPPSDEKLFLICANGRRDPCCSLQGLPLYRAMQAIDGASVWQTTHIGGHRFAATLVCLPHGLCYGRVGTDDAQTVVEAYRAGRLLPQFYRGRSAYDRVAQAAEYFLCQQTGNHDLNAFELMAVESTGENAWNVLFKESASGVDHTLPILGEMPAWEVYLSCNATEPERVMQFRLG